MRTLEDINAELEQVRQKLDRARKLSAVMEDLKAQHEERKRAAELLRLRRRTAVL